jgi:4-hydroxybenzoate polyprenyltransferase
VEHHPGSRERRKPLLSGIDISSAVRLGRNDLWDRKLDAKVERTKIRPLASGEITVAEAAKLLIALLGASLLVLLMLPPLAILLGFASMLLVVFYPAMKRITWLPQLFLGLTFNWGALMGWAAVTGQLSLPAFMLYMGGILWTLGYDTIYAHQDKEDDMLIGVKSTALLLGRKSHIYVAFFYAGALSFLLAAKYAAAPHALTPLLAVFPAAHMIWQIRAWDMDDPRSCLQIFRSNHVFGWLALLMLAI